MHGFLLLRFIPSVTEPHCVYSFAGWWTSGCFPGFENYQQLTMNIPVVISLWACACIMLGKYELLGPISVFNFAKVTRYCLLPGSQWMSSGYLTPLLVCGTVSFFLSPPTYPGLNFQDAEWCWGFLVSYTLCLVMYLLNPCVCFLKNEGIVVHCIFLIQILCRKENLWYFLLVYGFVFTTKSFVG